MSDQKKNRNDKNERRSFIKLGFASGVMALMAKAGFSRKDEKNPEKSGEKIKMLTPDGKLVEIDKNVLTSATNKKKASLNEIHHFVHYDKKQKG